MLKVNKICLSVVLFIILFITGFCIFSGCGEKNTKKNTKKDEPQIVLKLWSAKQNKWGSTFLLLENCSSIDLSHATLTFKSYGPNNELTENISIEATRGPEIWKCGDMRNFAFGDSEFLRYAQKCTVTVKVDGKEFVFDFTEELIRNQSKGKMAQKAKKTVVFIHGWQLNETDLTEVKQKLEGIFNGYTIDCYKWEASPSCKDYLNFDIFDKYYKKAQNEEPERLANYLIKNYWQDLDNLILVGHSLGGVITANTIKFLARNGRRIDRAIFLGTALPANDKAFTDIIYGNTHNPSLNIHSTTDEILGKIFKWFSSNNETYIWGFHGYQLLHDKSALQQIHSNNFCSDLIVPGHCVKHYLSTLEKFWRLKSEYGE